MNYENPSFITPLRGGKREYSLEGHQWHWRCEELACQLIFLCRFFAQAHETSLVSTIRLRNVLIAADDALDAAVDLNEYLGLNGRSMTKERSEVDNKFKKALDLLSEFAKEFPLKDPTSNSIIGGTVTGEVKNDNNFKSPTTILQALRYNLHSNPMDYNMDPPGSLRIQVVKFYILESLHDSDPDIVKPTYQDRPSCPKILWTFRNFRYSRDKKNCLTLKKNPHFYANLPTLLKAHGDCDSVKIDPTEDLQQADTYYVLTDRQEPVHIMIGNKILHSFGNLWRYKNTIIFKDIYGRLIGESIIKASLGGTYRELYITRFPVFTCVPRPFRTQNQHGLQPIVTESYPWTGWECFIDSPQMDSSAGFCLCIITERLAPNSPLLVPLPPTSEQPPYAVYRTHIHDLNNGSLLRIFTHYRLKHEENWNLQLMWRNLAQVCRRWRYFMFDLSSHLDICLFISKYSPPMDELSHLSSIPFILDYSDGTRTMTLQDEDNICLGLERHDHVCRVDLQSPSSSFHPWLLQMNQLFPRLVDLSLLSTTPETDKMSLVLPETLRAPNLRRLSLHGIGLRLPTGLSLLSSAIALSTLSLTHIRASCFFSPEHLVTQLKGLPHLEELSIGFAIPSSEGESLPPPISPVTVTLPALKQLTFRGVDAYLDNLVSRINTPFLERLTFTLHFDLTFTLVYLAEFIHRTEGFKLLVARVVFNKDGVSIDAGHSEQLGGDRSSLRVDVNCELLDWQIDSATQVCNSLGKALSTVEDLTVDLRVFGMPSDWESTLEDVPWHELLLPFVGVKKLHTGSSLSLELSQTLKSGGGGLVLPELEELEVSLKIGDMTNALTAFIETRESIGRHIRLLVPPEDERENMRLQNTLAMRRSRRQEMEYRWQRKVEAEREEKEIWKARAFALEELLKELDVSFSRPSFGGL